ncbi:hypothetical protein EV421DRAFT_1733123 [Armillaria borealis]|uniref:Uncharacterized protein n=1 Tax=Armillaria borealis TaxID=47425 RepID=A0AA39MVU6_9AGAR|nr:hypothetical protein EV421DRAFT_1733123 [Armillaria borealis]
MSFSLSDTAGNMGIDHSNPSSVTDQSLAGESASDIDKKLIQGLFKFTFNQPFEDYIITIAATLQCYKSKLILDELNNSAFTAFIEKMCAVKTVNNQIMYIFSPALMRPASDEVGTEDSVAMQRVSHWAQRIISEDTPLNNVYFDAKKHLYPLKIPPAQTKATKQANNTVPILIPALAAPTISDMPFGGNLLEYFFLQQQQQQYQQFQQMLQLQMLQTICNLLSHPPFIPSAPLSPAKIPVVSFEAFCAHYSVNNTDHDILGSKVPVLCL